MVMFLKTRLLVKKCTNNSKEKFFCRRRIIFKITEAITELINKIIFEKRQATFGIPSSWNLLHALLVAWEIHILRCSRVCKSVLPELVNKPSPFLWRITEFMLEGIKEMLIQPVPPEKQFRNTVSRGDYKHF